MSGLCIDEDVRIPMADGVTLSARIWRPAPGVARAVPAILEYIPYRYRDHTRARDETLHRWLAEQGYACARVDIRGSGESEGILTDEYTPQEIDDGYAVVEWLAGQPWCDGGVGMIGISWGGFSGLQVAARQPPSLKAVVSVCATDDRYADDIHTMGGCLLGDNLSWSSVMFAFNSLPPDPALRGDAWRGIWHERLAANAPWLMHWLSHPDRDAYWRHGSVGEDYAAIQCPVMAVSGWADGYTNAVFRLLANLNVPRQGIVGPWSHRYPHLGEPGPAIDFPALIKGWWDRWLKGDDNGVDEAPMLRAWIQDPDPPAPAYGTRPGRWIAESVWPVADRPPVTRHLHTDGRLTVDPPADPTARLNLQSPLGIGLFAGKWCSYANGPDLPDDQRREEQGGLEFQTEPLEASMELLGAPTLRLRVAADRPAAQLVARLMDVAPDGAATRISYGVLNLRHRSGHDQPADLEPGEAYDVVVRLNHLGHRLAAGHRLRLALSSSYWPLVWPAPEPVRLTLTPAAAALELPVREIAAQADTTVAFPPAPIPGAAGERERTAPRHAWQIRRDLGSGGAALEVTHDCGARTLDDVALTISDDTRETYWAQADDPLGVAGEVVADYTLSRGDWQVATRTRTRLESDAEAFIVIAELDAWEAGERIFSRNWHRRIPRAGR
jgi:putative CocE/NonD family hydrolase